MICAISNLLRKPSLVAKILACKRDVELGHIGLNELQKDTPDDCRRCRGFKCGDIKTTYPLMLFTRSPDAFENSLTYSTVDLYTLHRDQLS